MANAKSVVRPHLRAHLRAHLAQSCAYICSVVFPHAIADGFAVANVRANGRSNLFSEQCANGRTKCAPIVTADNRADTDAFPRADSYADRTTDESAFVSTVPCADSFALGAADS